MDQNTTTATEATNEATNSLLGKMQDFLGEHKTAAYATGAVVGTAALAGLGFVAYNKRQEAKAKKADRAQHVRNGDDMIKLMKLDTEAKASIKLTAEQKEAVSKQIEALQAKILAGKLNEGLAASDYEAIKTIEAML